MFDIPSNLHLFRTVYFVPSAVNESMGRLKGLKI